jgi:hypothetical protein
MMALGCQLLCVLSLVLEGLVVAAGDGEKGGKWREGEEGRVVSFGSTVGRNHH